MPGLHPTLHALVVGLASGAALVALVACGSVPDLVFVDDVADAAPDAPRDAPPDAPRPPDAGGDGGCGATGGDVCCGARVCRNCAPADCAECDACNASTTFCCRRQNGVQCRSGGSCN